MFKPVPVAIGLRYLRAKRRNGFISFVSLASILGIAIGVMVLITTLAVMSGFQREIKDRMLGMVAHATVTAQGEAMIGWEHAIDVAATGLRGVIERHGPQTVGVLASARLTNEENFLIQKLARTAIGTNSVHSCEAT